jgi:hypothetical protein
MECGVWGSSNESTVVHTLGVIRLPPARSAAHEQLKNKHWLSVGTMILSAQEVAKVVVVVVLLLLLLVITGRLHATAPRRV